MAEVTNFYLTFGNTMLAGKVHAMRQPIVRAVSEPKVIHAFRHKTALLDNRYPAVVYEFPFVVYTLGTSIAGFLDDFYGYSWLWELGTSGANLPRTLTLDKQDGTTIIDFGRCYFTDLTLEEPSETLVHSAGLVGVKFMGTTRPTKSDVQE